MGIKPTLMIDRMTQQQVLNYRRIKMLAEEERRLLARCRKLQEERKELESRLADVYAEKGVHQLRLAAKLILVRNTIHVPEHVRKAYSYSRWEEVAG